MPSCQLILAAAVLLAAPLLADEPQFCIAGTVVNGASGQPVRRAAVTLPITATLTDAAGSFRFCGLAAGSYYANAEKPGFLDAGAQLAVGPSREDVVLRLQPAGIIRGKVVDGDGAPLENVLIQLLSAAVEEGRRKVRVAASTATDDRGEYRLANLAPGRYYLRAAGWQGSTRLYRGAAAPDAGTDEAFAPIYYGGATGIDSAALVTVAPGSELDADFSVTLAPSYRIRGVIAGFSPRWPVQVELLRGEEEPSATPVVINAGTGAFQVNNVTPGSYVLRATQGEGDERMRGELPVEVSAADVHDVALALAGSVVLRGIVRTAADAGAAPSPPNCGVKLAPQGAWTSADDALEAATGEDGTFELPGVLPGRYRLRLDCANGYISAARFGDADLLARDEMVVPPGIAPPPVEAVLNTDGGTVDAGLSFEGEKARAWVLLLPDDGNELRTRFALCRDKLTFSGVAPGDYHAYAWTGSPEEFEYANPDARPAWASRAAGVHVGERDHQSVTLKIPAGESR